MYTYTGTINLCNPLKYLSETPFLEKKGLSLVWSVLYICMHNKVSLYTKLGNKLENVQFMKFPLAHFKFLRLYFKLQF